MIPTEQENIPETHLTHSELISNIFNEQVQIDKKKKDNPIEKKRTNNLNRQFHKEEIQQPINMLKGPQPHQKSKNYK